MKKSKAVAFQPLVIIMFVSLILASCSSTTGPVTIRESANINHEKNNTRAVDHNGTQASQRNDRDTIAFVEPVRPDVKRATIPIIEKLVQQANQQFQASNYTQSITTAERGLRINRKEPRLYLALTKAYKRLDNNRQSAFFAKQGLRYATKNSPVFFELKEMSNN